MPINNTKAISTDNSKGVIPRIQYEETPIRRVYQGDKIVWGLFDAKYKTIKTVSSNAIRNGGTETVGDDTTNPELFTWGIGVPSLKAPAGVNGAAFIKWCTNPQVTTKTTGIDIDTKLDTVVYAKWYIQGTQYKISYRYWVNT